MIRLIITVSYMSIISSCSLFEQPEKKAVISPHWEHDFNVGYFSSIDPILYKDKVIYSGLDEKKNDFSANSTLEAFDRLKGDLIWKWSDNIPSTFDQFSDLNSFLVKDNILYISSGWEYAINLDEGKTKFENDQNKLDGVNFAGNDKYLLTTYTSLDQSSVTVEYSFYNDFAWEVLYERTNVDTSIYYFKNFNFDEKESSILYIPYSKWNGVFSSPYLMSFDISSKTKILDEPIDLEEKGRFIDNKTFIHEGLMYMPCNGYIICVNAKSADLIWQVPLNGNTSASGILITKDGNLFAKAEFGLYNIDKGTGNIIWENSLSGEGNASKLGYHNEVIYYIGGGRFHAVDSNSGQKIFQIEAPSYLKDPGAFFQPVLTIDHENDRIYTASYTHAYCYPTLR